MHDMRIYVASLCDYNAGILHGKWIDVTDVETMEEQIGEILKTSPTALSEGCEAEEWAVHDSSGFGPYKINEHPKLKTLVEIAEGVEEHGEAFLAWVANSNSNETDVSSFLDSFQGEWDSLADYAADYWEESGDELKAPKGVWWHPLNYVDWKKMGRDLELSGDIWTEDAPGGKIWVFDNH